MKTKIILLATGFLFVVLRPGAAQLQSPVHPSARHVEGELLVKYRGGPRGAAAERARDTMKHEVKRHFDFIGWQHIRLPAGMAVEEGLARFRALPNVLAVEPNSLARAIAPVAAPAPLLPAGGGIAAVPNDPQFGQQWSLAKIGATNAWAFSTGNTDVVAVVTDSGVNYNHEDLRDNMWHNPGEIPGNGIDDDGNGFLDDVHGIDAIDNDGDPFPISGNYHGTAVAGIIGAVGNNRKGLAGVNWSVRIMAIRLVLANELIPLADRLQAFDYILLMKARGVNIRVVNMSWGDSNFYQPQQDALAALDAAGILQVAATLNSATDVDVTPDYPGNHQLPSIIAVADSDVNDLLLSSGYGRTNVDLAAPGAAVPLVWGPGNSNYFTGSGTSFAAPLVAGAVALLAALNPQANAAEIKTALLESVDVLPAFTNRMVSNGRLNIGRAVLHPLIARGPPRIATHPQTQSVIVGSNASLSVSVGGTHPLNYQWLFNGGALTNATDATLTLSTVNFGQSGDYSVVVSNSLGGVASGVATMTVVPLLITADPQSRNVRFSSNVTFRVSVISPEPPAYQWRFNGADLPGATSSTLHLTNVQLVHEGGYSVRVSNSLGSAVSSNAALAVLVNPVITQAPVSQSVVQGGSVTFSVSVQGNPLPFGYLWRRGSVNLAFFSLNQRNCFFTLTNVQPSQGGPGVTYRVVITNLAQPILSVNATWNLTVLADSDGDGLPDVWEAAYGFPTNNASNATLDDDSDGLANLQEYLAGTNPTNALSYLRVDTIGLVNDRDTARLTFHAMSNKTYTVQSSPVAQGDVWNRVADVPAVATNRILATFDTSRPSGERQRFYRLVTPRSQ